jgi:hypothetical protein
MENKELTRTQITSLVEARDNLEEAKGKYGDDLAVRVGESYKPLLKAGLISALYLVGRVMINNFVGGDPINVPENPETFMQYLDSFAICATAFYGGIVGLSYLGVRSDTKEVRENLIEAKNELEKRLMEI